MVTKMEDRIKVDLVAVSKLIRDNLQLCDVDSLHTTETLTSIAVQFNQGALLQYQYGDIERAETLCRAAIELFAELSSDPTNRTFCQASMVAPYINLARIYGQKGEVKESLSIFDDIYRFGLQQQDLVMFGHRIKATDGPALIQTSGPAFQKLLLSCRVVEAARVLQTVEDYSALLALVESNASLPEYQDVFFQQYLFEIRSRALLRLGQYDMALEALEECCRLMSSTNTDRIVAHLLLSQIYREWGRNDEAVETLNRLEEHLAAVAQFVKRLPVLRQLAYRLALERYAMGDNAGALKPAEQAFKWCNELNDESGRIKTAILLLRICDGASSHWFEELRQLASSTFFRLERACAYWELGVAADHDGSAYLQNSHDLYHSIPFVDSRRSCETLNQLLDSRVDISLSNVSAWENSPEIDSIFYALLEYAPKSFAATHAC
jgi:tetratricopeptide (TPR) repeat protein